MNQRVDAGANFSPMTPTLALSGPVLARRRGGIGLSSAGTLTQSGVGLIVGSQLETVSVNATSLELPNLLGNATGAGTPGLLAGRVLTAGQSFGFRDDANSLSVDTVDVQKAGGVRLTLPSGNLLTAALSGVATQAGAGGNILIETTTSGNLLLNQRVDAAANFNPATTALALSGPVLLATPGEIGLSSAGTLSQSGAGLIVGSQLETVSVNATSLPLANLLGNATGAGTPGLLAGQVLAAGQTFTFSDDNNSLSVASVDVQKAGGVRLTLPSGALLTGPLNGLTTANGNANVTTTTAGNVTLVQPVNLGTGTFSVISAGTIAEAAAGTVTAATLTGSSAGNATFGLAGNVIANLGAFATTTGGANGNFTLVDAQALAITGPVITGTGTVSLTVAGGITEVAGGTVTAGTLTGSAAGDATFAQPGNMVANLGAFAANNFTLVDGQALNVAGPVNVGAGTVNLTVAGTISEGAGGSVTAGLLTGSSGGNAIFGQPGNLVTNLGAFSTAGGNFTLADGQALNLTGLLSLGGGAATLNAARAITELVGGSIAAGTLTGSSAGNATFDQANAIGNLAAFTAGSGGVFALTNNEALNVSGPVASGGDLRIRVNGGDLTLTGGVSAGGGNANAALISTNGNAVEQGNGVVTAAGLIVNAAANVTFGIATDGTGAASPANANNVGTLAGTAGGSFGFLNGPGLTVGTVPQVVDVPSQTGVQAGGDVLIQSNNTGQAFTLAGNVAAGGRAVFDSAGPFAQTGVVTVTAPVLVVDTTGDGVAAVLKIVNSTNVDSAIVTQFPTATTTNALQLENLNAPNAVTFLVAGLGAVSGQLQVKQLGVSGLQPGNANLTGSVGGIGGPGAAATAVPSPRPQNQYLLNNCVIGSPNCILLPPVVPVQPQPVNDVDVLTLSPQSEDPDAPLINVYDEERLCNPRSDAPPEEREFCQ